MTKTSELFFARTLEQKTAEARAAVAECISQFLSPKTTKRQPSAEAALAAVGRLLDMLHQTDHPAWLPRLHEDLVIANSHSGDQDSVRALHRITSELYPQLTRHEWNMGTPESASGFDFDAIYEKYRSECGIPELFDTLVKYLKEIVATDAIDSVTALRELNKIIATLHGARMGSYFATRGAWNFVTTWLKNTGWELLGRIPVAGDAVKGLRTTLKETNVQMDTLHDKIQADLEKQVATDIPRLEYNPPALPALGCEQEGSDEKPE